MKRAELQFIASMVIFGSMGLIVRHSALPAPVLVLVRGAVGALFLLLMHRLGGQRFSAARVGENLKQLVLCGAALGADWIFLFEAYKRTTVAVATVAYYLAPVILIALSAVFLNMRLSAAQIVCMLLALGGTVLISGAGGLAVGRGDLYGVLCGILAAVSYALLTLLGRSVQEISTTESSIVQFGVAILMVLPYALLTQDLSALAFPPQEVLWLLVLGVVHTGTAFWLYFASIRRLRPQRIALLCYLDPLTALVLSALVLGERLVGAQLVGAALIFGATVLGRLGEAQKAGVRHSN